MAVFRYKALDQAGNPVEGAMEEASARRVMSSLEERGLQVNSVEEVGAARTFPKRSRLSWSDLEILNSQLLTLVQGGLPLAPSIRAMARDLRNPRIRWLLESVREDLEAGKSLSEAFSRQERSLPPLYVTLVRAGERAGNLSAVFEALTDYSRRMLELRSSFREVLTYPILVIIVAAIVVFFVMVKVVPVYEGIFSDFGGQLPGPTRLLLSISRVFAGHSAGAVACVVLFVGLMLFLWSLAWRQGSSGYGLDWTKLRVPVLGPAYRQASLARFSRAFAMMLEAHVPMAESLTLAAAASGNAVLGRAVRGVIADVESGRTLAEGFERSGHFDHGTCWLVRNAEERGELPRSLIVLEESCERSINWMRRWFEMFAGPVVVVAVAIVIGYIVVSLYLPIFSLGDVISGH